MEIIVIIGIIAIISVITVPKLADFQQQQALNNTSEDIVSLLNEARNSTISSKNSNTYGVHFQTDKAILFAGTSYSSSPSNKQIDFDSAVISPITGGINLSGNGSDVVFERITGETTQNGTIVLELVKHTDKQKIITINLTGVIDVN